MWVSCRVVDVVFPPGDGTDRQWLKLKLKRLKPTEQMNPRPPGQRGRGIRPHNVSQCPCYLAGMSGKDRPQVNKTMMNEAVRLGNRHGMEDGLGAPTPRPKEHIHHVHHRDVAIGHLRHGGITATMRRSESFVRTPGLLRVSMGHSYAPCAHVQLWGKPCPQGDL